MNKKPCCIFTLCDWYLELEWVLFFEEYIQYFFGPLNINTVAVQEVFQEITG